MSHSGYANYETFSIAVVIDNDQPLYHEARQVVADTDGDCDAFRSWVEERFIEPFTDNDTIGILSALVDGALSEVDWYELVDQWLPEEEEEEEEKEEEDDE